MFANQFAPCDGRLRVEFLSVPEKYEKSDSFVLRYGKEVWLIDGGILGTTYTDEHLMDIRASFLKDHPELLEDTSCKLAISVIISHFHIDHVGAFSRTVIDNDFISIQNFYCGPISGIDPKYNEVSPNGDILYRSVCLEKLEKRHKDCKIYTLGYGKDDLLKFTSCSGLEKEVEFSLLPPSADWGVGERFEYMTRIYDIVTVPRKTNLYTLNSSSIWVHVRLGENTFMFTGDTIKRSDVHNDEALDEMADLYAEEYSPITVMKYVHHGVARDNAVLPTLRFKPENLVFTSNRPSTPKVIKEKYSELCEGIGLYVSGPKGLCFECTADSKVEVVE